MDHASRCHNKEEMVKLLYPSLALPHRYGDENFVNMCLFCGVGSENNQGNYFDADEMMLHYMTCHTDKIDQLGLTVIDLKRDFLFSMK